MKVSRSMQMLRLRILASAVELLRINLSEGLIRLRLLGVLVGLDLSIKERHETPLVVMLLTADPAVGLKSNSVL